MRIASSVAWCALGLGVLCQGGALGCSSSDAGAPSVSGGATAVGGAGAPGAGAGGTSSAGTSSAGAGVGGGGAPGGASAGGSAGTAAVGGASGTGGMLGGAGGDGGSGGGASAPFLLTSPSFVAMAGCSKDNVAACDQFPTDMLLEMIGGSNHSPELDWGPGPTGTLSYAIVLHDDSNNYTHWAVWNIPASARKLPASLANGSDPNGLTGVKQVSFNGAGDAYAGPGAHSHVYQFKLYALKVAAISPTLSNPNPQTAVGTALEADPNVLATTDLRAASGP